MIIRVVADTDAAERRFELVADRGEDLRPALHAAADALRGLYGDVFDQRGAPAGVFWPSPTPGYRRLKLRLRPTAGPGVFTGLLRTSLTRRRGRHSVQRITGDELTVGTSAPHAHLFDDGRGGQRARRLTPTRRRIIEATVPALERHLHDERFTGLA